MGINKPDPDSTIKYMGFGIHPGEIKEFWASEDEKKKYLNNVKAAAELSLLDRDTSLLNAVLMSPVDKAVSLLGGLILIIAFFLPAYSIDPDGKAISGSAISFFLNIPIIGGYAAYGGPIMILTAIVFGLILLACPAAGILNILGLLNKAGEDNYLETVKKYSRFNYVPIVLYILLIAILAVGAAHPFGSLGIKNLGDTLHVGAIFSLTGFGFWLNIVGLTIGFAQSRGI